MILHRAFARDILDMVNKKAPKAAQKGVGADKGKTEKRPVRKARRPTI